MRNSLAAALILTGILTGCDPVVQVEATVSVSDELAAARTGELRDAVVVIDDANGSDRVVGVICGPTGGDQVFTYLGSHIGCAREADVSAVLIPVDDSWACGGAYEGWNDGVPTNSPIATTTVFSGLFDSCEGALATVALRLE